MKDFNSCRTDSPFGESVPLDTPPTKSNNTRLSNEQVKKIKILLKEFQEHKETIKGIDAKMKYEAETVRSIAQTFNVSRVCIVNIKNNKTYKNIII